MPLTVMENALVVTCLVVSLLEPKQTILMVLETYPTISY